MPAIRILIVDDHAVVRSGVRQILSAVKEFVVVGEAGDPVQALSLAKTLAPDVVMVDISMPGGNGLELVRQLRRQQPQAVTVILTLYDKDIYVHQALEAGAFGYILKGAPAADIVSAVRSAWRREYYLSSEIRDGVIDSYVKKRQGIEAKNDFDLLSEREQEVFRLLAEGHSTARIADMLFVSPKTVEKHRANIMRKLSLENMVGLVKYAIRLGVVEPEFWRA
ncbi:MAG: response regulator [Trichloromonadaceae bacterium]